jgi:hypothetical protein
MRLSGKSVRFGISCLAGGGALEVHKGAEAAVGGNDMGLRKPQRCCGPGARWLWNSKTAAADPESLLPQSHVSPQLQSHSSIYTRCKHFPATFFFPKLHSMTSTEQCVCHQKLPGRRREILPEDNSQLYPTQHHHSFPLSDRGLQICGCPTSLSSSFASLASCNIQATAR